MQKINQVWTSSKPNGGWRVHTPQEIQDILNVDIKVDAIKRATEISKRIGILKPITSFGRNPFPPRRYV